MYLYLRKDDFSVKLKDDFLNKILHILLRERLPYNLYAKPLIIS